MRIQAPHFRRFARSSKPNSYPPSKEDLTIPDDAPSVAESDVSLDFEDERSYEPRIPLQWEFKGLTLWIEYEEHDHDLSRAIEGASRFYGTELIPMPHSTAVYGMQHLSQEEAIQKLNEIPALFPQGWPSKMDRPISVKQDVAVEGRPGQVCSISWAELTLKTNDLHEEAVDKLYELFEVSQKRTGPWTPHISLAYDNPEDSVLNLADTISYVAQNPSLMDSRRIQAVSLWSTEGKMAQWKCLDRVSFF